MLYGCPVHISLQPREMWIPSWDSPSWTPQDAGFWPLELRGSHGSYPPFSLEKPKCPLLSPLKSFLDSFLSPFLHCFLSIHGLLPICSQTWFHPLLEAFRQLVQLFIAMMQQHLQAHRVVRHLFQHFLTQINHQWLGMVSTYHLLYPH